MDDVRKLSTLATVVVSFFDKEKKHNFEKTISVSPVISKFATWYEKLRTAMEYREEEVILRAAIERILKRRLMLGGNAKTTAEPLIRELLWARYLAENSVPESIILKVEESIDLHLALRFAILKKHKISENIINEWISQLISADIENILKPNPEKEIIINFMFHVFRTHVSILDDNEESKDAQVYIAIRKAFARDDEAFLRYFLFKQYFGELKKENLEKISSDFNEGFKEINQQMAYPGREKAFNYIKRRTPAFLILEDVLRVNKGNAKALIANKDEFESLVLSTCNNRYKNISSKVRRAIVKSVIFVFLTKAVLALLVEGSYERYVYGRILWFSMALNVFIPPALMVFVGVLIKAPGEDNSRRILSQINTLLYEESPSLGSVLTFKKNPDKKRSISGEIFALLWLLAFFLSFGGLIYLLSRLNFNIVSQAVFIFFLAIVSFLSFRISRISGIYTVSEKQSFLTPVVDFLFMPVIRVGRYLTAEVSRLNFILLIFDFLIETPFKISFAFLEQWFIFLHSKRDEME